MTNKTDDNAQKSFGEMLKSWFRRPQVWGFFLSTAIIAVVALIFFAPDNFEGNSLMQADMQQGLANGHEAQVYHEATGEKALWTNSLFSGMPTFQISPEYPSNALFTWLNTVYGLGLPVPSNLLFMMMFGFLIMLFCMDMKWYYALLGSLAWGFSSYFVIIIGAGHIWKFVALSYIPPTIGGLVLCYRGRYLMGGALTALFAMLQLNANHPQMTYYFAFVMVAMVIAFLVTAWREKKLRRWLIAGACTLAAGILAVGANLPSLYNTYEYAKQTKRSQSELTPAPSADGTPSQRPTGGLPYGEIVGWSYGGSEMMSLLIPNIKGGATSKPEKGSHIAMTLDKVDGANDVAPDIQQLLPYFSQYFNDSEGTNGPVYVGAIIVALFLLGCIIVRGPMKWALLIMTALSCLLALGRNFPALTDFMIFNFPMYSKFRAVESILVIAEFTMPLLAVMALARYIDVATDSGTNARTRNRLATMLCVAFSIPALFCLIGIFAPDGFGDTITSSERGLLAQVGEYYGIAAQTSLADAVTTIRLGMVRADSMRSLLFLAIGFAAMWFCLKGSLSCRWTVAILAGAILVDLFAIDKRYVNSDSFARTSFYQANYYEPFPEDAIDRAILADTTAHYRVMDIPGFTSPNRSYRHKTLGGYHAAKLNRYEDIIQRQLKPVLQYGYLPELREDSIADMYPESDRPIVDRLRQSYRILDMLNARYVITGDKEYPVLPNPDALGNAWLIDEIAYVANADQEMAALNIIDPAHSAVADSTFLAALGSDIVKPEAGDTIRLTNYTPNTLTYHVDTRAGGIAVFSEVYFPWGWKATIDGVPAPLARVDYILRALRLPAGEHTVIMTFDPDSIHTTSAIAYACVTLIYLALLLTLFCAYIRKNP